MTDAHIYNATSLQEGSIVKLCDTELTITHISKVGNWVEMRFDKTYWDPFREVWKSTYGCYFGFCFEVVKL